MNKAPKEAFNASNQDSFVFSLRKVFQSTPFNTDRASRFSKPIEGDSIMGVMRLARMFAVIYPKRAFLGLALNITLSVVELIGLSALLPLLLLLNVGSISEASSMTEAVLSAFAFLNIEFQLFPVLLVTLGLGVLVTLLRSITTVYISFLTEKIRVETVAAIIQTIKKASWATIEKEGRSALFSAIQTEAAYIGRAGSKTIQFFGSIIALCFYCVMALFVSWKMTILLIVGGAIAGILINPILKKSSATGSDIATTNRGIKQSILEFLGSQKLIRAMNADATAGSHLNALIERIASRSLMMGAIPVSISAVMEMVMLLGLLVAVYMMSAVLHEPAEEIILLLVIFSRLTPKVILTQQILASILGNLPSFRIMAETRSRLSETVGLGYNGSKEIQALSGGIEFSDVSLSLSGKQILKSLNLTIPANKFIALVGESGGGKSTIVDCLTGMRVPQIGEIIIDGVSMKDIDIRQWRSLLSIVPQEHTFIKATIRDNFHIFAPDATDQDIWYALREADAEKFVRDRPEQLDTVLGDDALNVSGGQRQRLAIARALLRKPKILLMDEPTSALDDASQEAIRSTIEHLKNSYTIIVVTHRLDLAQAADYTFKIADGRCV